MCVLAPICGSQRLYRPRKIQALAQESGMTVAQCLVSGLRTPFRLCLNFCGIIREYENSTVGVSRIYDSQPGIQ